MRGGSLILAFETSTPFCSVALGRGGELLGYAALDMPNRQAEELVPLVEQVLRDAGLWYDALDAIAVTTGPGSFTGVRIALAAARGMALAAGKPLLGCSTLECIAYAYVSGHLFEAGGGAASEASKAHKGAPAAASGVSSAQRGKEITSEASKAHIPLRRGFRGQEGAPALLSKWEKKRLDSRFRGNDKEEVAVVLDARRGQCFWQCFSADGAALTEPALGAVEEVARALTARGVRRLLGSGAPPVGAMTEEALEVLDGKAHSDARILLRWAAGRAAASRWAGGAQAGEVAPLYIRPPDAKPPRGAGLKNEKGTDA